MHKVALFIEHCGMTPLRASAAFDQLAEFASSRRKRAARKDRMHAIK